MVTEACKVSDGFTDLTFWDNLLVLLLQFCVNAFSDDQISKPQRL